MLPPQLEPEDITGWNDRPMGVLTASRQADQGFQLELARRTQRALGDRLTVIDAADHRLLRGPAFYDLFIDRSRWPDADPRRLRPGDARARRVPGAVMQGHAPPLVEAAAFVKRILGGVPMPAACARSTVGGVAVLKEAPCQQPPRPSRRRPWPKSSPDAAAADHEVRRRVRLRKRLVAGQAAKALADHRVHAVLVLRTGSPERVGWLTSRALMERLLEYSPFEPVADAVTEKVTSIAPSATVGDAIRALAAPGVTHLLVTNGAAAPQGVVSRIHGHRALRRNPGT